MLLIWNIEIISEILITQSRKYNCSVFLWIGNRTISAQFLIISSQNIRWKKLTVVNILFCCKNYMHSNNGEGLCGSVSQVVGLPKTHTSLSSIRREFAPGFGNYKKGALDSPPQVIKFISCLPIVGGFLRVLRLLPPLKLLAMIQLKYC